MREWQGKGAQVSLASIGTKGMTFFRRLTRRCSATSRASATARTSRT
jgi:hypothetical protein